MRRTAMMRWVGAVLASGAVLVACAQAPTPGGPSAPSGAIDVGSGRQIHVECSGSGDPAVILVSGQGFAADAWQVVPDASKNPPIARSDQAVYQSLSRVTEVCAYDRPNTAMVTGEPSRSTSVGQPVTATDAAADLHKWLTAAHVAPPYVLVGHSFGGMIVVRYAQTYPKEVAGIVLVDPANRYLRDEVDRAWWDTAQKVRLAAVTASGPETADFDASTDAIIAGGPVPKVPSVVLTSDQMPPQMIDEEHFPAWLAAHRQLAHELGATHITKTNSGHNIQIEQPALVVESIVTVLDAVRSASASAAAPSGS